MAIEWYLRSLVPAEVSPPFDPAWDVTTGAARRAFGLTALAADTLADEDYSWTPGQLRLGRQYVSWQLREGIVLDLATVLVLIASREFFADDNITSRMGLRVFDSTGSILRATLLPVGHYGTGLEFEHITANARLYANNTPIGSHTTMLGDRIVAEFGGSDAGGTTPEMRLRYGSSGLPTTGEGGGAARNPVFRLSIDLPLLEGAKVGTRFLGKADMGFTDLASDRSQDDGDMTATATSITENPTTRYDQSHPRTIPWRCTQTNASTGMIFNRYRPGGAMGTDHETIDTTGGTIRARRGGVTIGTLTLPGVSGSSQAFLCAWISIANPDTTGASDAVLSWLVAQNLATNEVARVAFTHAALGSSTDRASWGDRDGAGTSPYTGTLTMVGFHDRPMTLSELLNDFVAVTEEPSTEFVEERMPLPLDLTLGLHLEDELHGPAAAWAARNHQQLRRRLASTCQSRYTTAPDLRALGQTQPYPSKVRLAVGSATYQWHLGWLHVWPVPAGCNEAWVQVTATLNDGGTEVGPTDVGIRVYSMNRLPGALGGLQPGPGNAEAYEQFYAEGFLDASTFDIGQLAEGVPITIGRLPLARATTGIRKGKTYLAVAYAIDPLGTADPGQADEQRISFGNLHVVPGFLEPEDGGIGFGLGG